MQNYTRSRFGFFGQIDLPKDAELTQMSYEFYPEALANVIRSVHKEFKDDIIVTENGIATTDDSRRMEFIRRALDGGAVPPLPTQTFLLRYLLETKEAAWSGEWKTFREMPWGELYIKPYTGRVLTRAAFTFGTRVAKFRAACEKMGADPVKHGDAGFRFNLIGGYQMQILVWEGDDEFPPNAQILYSDNFAEGFAAEDRVVADDILISTVKSFM